MMNSYSLNQRDDDCDQLSSASKSVFNLNTKHPYIANDHEDEYFGKWKLDCSLLRSGDA